MHEIFAPSMALDRAERDRQFSPSRSAKDAAGALARMVERTDAALRDTDITVERDLVYGARPRARLDLFRPSQAGAEALPCLAFIHGGFWQEGDKSVSGFAAARFAAQGWAWASIGYTLTPDVSLTELTGEICDALDFLHARAAALGLDANRIVLAGHSAGGHLAAIALADVLDRGSARKIAGAVLVSGVFELAPVAASYVNDLARLSAAEVQRLSPARCEPQAHVPVHILYGADEPEAFRLQSEGLHRLWAPHLDRLSLSVTRGRDHFDVLDEMNDPASETMRRIAEMV
ncbi:alpha/beta hydrolase [Marimonas sp. MJW-29]|uniref:Alpha/beta hydrolase n=1 Tax=Sulfitobacter sediminis TaxID=3234186 RepID=A0ABV3RLJ1_9RHOB